jgi:hypothetical protein
MDWAESIYINSGLRTKRSRRTVIPKLITLGGRIGGLDVLDIGFQTPPTAASLRVFSWLGLEVPISIA